MCNIDYFDVHVHLLTHSHCIYCMCASFDITSVVVVTLLRTPPAVTPHRGQIVPNDIPINIFATHCNGDEANLTSCEHEVSTRRCNHSLDVVLTCRGLLIYIHIVSYFV